MDFIPLSQNKVYLSLRITTIKVHHQSITRKQNHVSVDDIPSVIHKVYDQSILFIGIHKEPEPIGALWRNNEKKDRKCSA